MQGENRADITRDTFDQTKHFSRVLLQQGRVEIEADFNEQTGIVSHYLRTLAADLIGPHGGPGDSFQVQQLTVKDAPPDFRIQAGHYYVQGILCELDHAPVAVTPVPTNNNQLIVRSLVADQTEFLPGQYVELFDASSKTTVKPIVTSIRETGDQKELAKRTITFNNKVPVFGDDSKPSLRRVTTYLSQPDFADTQKNPLGTAQNYLVYLDVWERHISYVEDEDGHNPGIREVALGGPDTATRARVIWQVKVHPVPVALNADTMKNDYDAFLSTLEDVVQPGSGRLMARVHRGTSDDVSPCVISPESRYRGIENQLYRIEIHQQGKVGTASFKWSRENSAVIFPIRILADDQATVESLGRDSGRGLQGNNWVEIVDDDSVLQNQPELLRQVTLIDTAKLQVNFKPLKSGPPNPFGRDSTRHPLLRRWDSPDAVPVEIPSTNNGWITLEDGIEVKFDPDGVYKTGDYWLIPARTATGNVEWPTALDAIGNPIPLPILPRGIQHYYAPLAVITVANGAMTAIDDARRVLKALI